MKKLLIIIGVTVGLNTSTVAGPIHEAAKTGDIVEVKSLISLGANVDHRDTSVNGSTPLWHAIEGNRFEIADFLVSVGANVNVKRLNDGKTPLFMAVQRDVRYVNLLINNGANVDERDRFGTTPVHYGNGIELLINNGANVNNQNNLGINPLMSRVGNPKAITALLLSAP